MIPFTQFKMPDGRKVPVEIGRPAHIEAMALSVIEAGYRFETEMLTTGGVVFYVTNANTTNDEPLAVTFCQRNGPEVCEAVDELVRYAFARINDVKTLTE